jgi:hypothetical protein
MAIAAPAIIQPDELAAQDVFIYEFLPNMNLHSSGFELLLATGDTTSGHDIRSLIKFDLTAISLSATETATLNLYTIDTTAAGFGVSPTPGAPVTTNVHLVTSAWTETATWNSQPAFNPTPAASALVNGVGQWISFDITEVVEGWLDDPSTNQGLVLTQAAPVTNGGVVAAVYNSSSAPSNRPYLQIVPEPSAMGLCALALILALHRGRRIA